MSRRESESGDPIVPHRMAAADHSPGFAVALLIARAKRNLVRAIKFASPPRTLPLWLIQTVRPTEGFPRAVTGVKFTWERDDVVKVPGETERAGESSNPFCDPMISPEAAHRAAAEMFAIPMKF